MVIDGIFYKDDEPKPDLGSLRCASSVKSPITGKQIREYYGLSSDASKLPTVADYPKYADILGSGSIAIFTDTGEASVYDEVEDSWNQL